MSPKKSGRSPGNPAGKPKSGMPKASEDMLLAAVDMIGHTGSESFEMRYSDDEEPVIWMAVGKWGDIYEVGASTSPVRAALRLLDTVMDGGTCQHCGRPTGVSEDFDSMPLSDLFCWYQFDPELKKFRRGCAGEAA